MREPVVIIRGVPSREAYHGELARALPGAVWSIDQAGRGARWNFERALELQGDAPAIHIEDDAVLARDFMARADVAIGSHHQPCVTQFFSRRAGDITLGSRHSGVFLYGICFYLPAEFAAPLREFATTWGGWERDPSGIDLCINAWLRQAGRRHWIEVPNLADHRIGPSAIDRRRSSKRQSRTFVP